MTILNIQNDFFGFLDGFQFLWLLTRRFSDDSNANNQIIVYPRHRVVALKSRKYQIAFILLLLTQLMKNWNVAYNIFARIFKEFNGNVFGTGCCLFWRENWKIYLPKAETDTEIKCYTILVTDSIKSKLFTCFSHKIIWKVRYEIIFSCKMIILAGIFDNFFFFSLVFIGSF